MKYYSTNDSTHLVSLQEAVLRGLAPDQGLYMPERIPTLPADFFARLPQYDFPSIALEVVRPFLSDDLPDADIREMVNHTLQFDAPVVEVEPNLFSLELYHGPTMAFKDFGARFLSGLLGYFARLQQREVVILAATSGDTGSAVANGFLGVPGTRVVVLYPKGKVSEIQEKQFTTLGKNVLALEVDGTFDDCQRLVKQAFNDSMLREKLFLTSANSINIARLLPQMFYYFWAYRQLMPVGKPVVVSVPSGNFGNLAAGLLAKRMGLPIQRFVASTNINDVVPMYLAKGIFLPRTSQSTISNAMDVGNPSNFVRIQNLYRNERDALLKDVRGYSFTDYETAEAMRLVWQRSRYLLDPHGAIGYLGLKRELQAGEVGVFLETAHPGKFKETVEESVKDSLELPQRLKDFLVREKKSIPMAAHLDELRSILLQ